MPGRRQHWPKPHPPQPDGVQRHGGAQTCTQCQLPTTHQIHTIPTTHPDIKAAEERRLGEREEPE